MATANLDNLLGVIVSLLYFVAVGGLGAQTVQSFLAMRALPSSRLAPWLLLTLAVIALIAGLTYLVLYALEIPGVLSVLTFNYVTVPPTSSVRTFGVTLLMDLAWLALYVLTPPWRRR